jgi:hypothetical protein
MKKYKLCQSILPIIEGGGRKHKKKNKNPLMYRESTGIITINKLNTVVNKNNYITAEYPLNCPNHLYTPTILPPVHRIVVLGDIHGDMNLLLTMLKKAKVIEINNNKIIWTGGQTYVVQVGDQVDRCRPLGALTCEHPSTTYKDEASDIKILKLANELKVMARQQGGDFISLLGNHELMNAVGQMSYVSHKNIQEFENYTDKKNPNLVFRSPLEARKYAFLPGNEYGKLLGCTRMACVIIGSHIFVHAGLVDGMIAELNMNSSSDLETINTAISKWLLGLLSKDYIDHIINGSRYSMFWTRILGSIPPNTDFENPVCIDHIKNVLSLFKVNNIVIGHTPQVFLFDDKINQTCSGKVWRVDNGSSMAFHKFDEKFMNTGQVSEGRKPMVLEIIDDKIYNVIK